MRKLFIIFIAFTLTLGAAEGLAKDRLLAEALKEAPEVTPKELKEMLENDAKIIVLDIREKEQRAEGSIKTLDKYEVTRCDLEFFVPEMIKDQNTTIVTYCRSGPRGALAAQTLRKMGYKNAKNLKGGLKGWVEAGYTLKTGLGMVALSKDDEF